MSGKGLKCPKCGYPWAFRRPWEEVASDIERAADDALNRANFGQSMAARAVGWCPNCQRRWELKPEEREGLKEQT